MLLILPEASIEAAAQRAEQLRARAKKLEVRHLDTALGPVTVSLGVAVYPGTGERVMRCSLPPTRPCTRQSRRGATA